MKSITLLGSSSGRNAGDAALISGIMDSIDQTLGRKISYEIPTTNPSFVRSAYTNEVKPISLLPWHLTLKMLGLPTYRSILRSDLSLVFDAVLFDRALFNPLFNFLSSIYVLLRLAKKRDKGMGFFNVSVGPLKTSLGKKMVRELAEMMDFITVRDDASFQLLQELGVKNKNILVTADAALLVPGPSAARIEEILKDVALDPQSDILGINVSAYLDTWADRSRASIGRDKFVAMYSAALNRVALKLQVPLLFVCTQHHDVPLTRDIMARVANAPKKALVSNIEYSHHELKGILERVALLFAMRLHAIILATSSFTPVLALPHQPKVNAYLKTLELLDVSLPFDEFSEDALVSHLLSGWEKRKEIREKLEMHIPHAKARALWGAEIVAGMAHGETPEATIAAITAQEAPRKLSSNWN